MQIKRVVVILASFFILQGFAYAKSQAITQSKRQLITFYKEQSLPIKIPDLSGYQKCVDNSLGVTINLMNCSGNEITRQDNTLNRLYRSLIQKLEQKKRNSLQSAQRRWITDRDKACDVVSEEERGGSLSAVIYNDCIVVLTTKRKIELKKLLDSL